MAGRWWRARRRAGAGNRRALWALARRLPGSRRHGRVLPCRGATGLRVNDCVGRAPDVGYPSGACPRRGDVVEGAAHGAGSRRGCRVGTAGALHHPARVRRACRCACAARQGSRVGATSRFRRHGRIYQFWYLQGGGADGPGARLRRHSGRMDCISPGPGERRRGGTKRERRWREEGLRGGGCARSLPGGRHVVGRCSGPT